MLNELVNLKYGKVEEMLQVLLLQLCWKVVFVALFTLKLKVPFKANTLNQ
jgi:hypothetical protein